MDLFKYSTGFTFLQLIIALSVIMILLMVGVPNLSDFVKSSRLKSVVHLFYNNLQLARAEAIRGNDDVYVSFTTGANWCYGVNKTTSCSCTVADSCTIDGTEKVSNSSAFQSVTMSLSGFSGNLQFERRRGVLVGNGGTVTFALGDKNIQVQINALGRARICSDTVGGYNTC